MDKRRLLAEYGKKICGEKLVIGAGGNISLRDEDRVYIKKANFNMAEGSVEGYIDIDLTEKYSLNKELSSETPLHIASYEAREDVKAVIHVHSPFMIAVAHKVTLLRSTSYEFDCILKKEVPSLEYIQPGSEDLASAVGVDIKRGANAVLMKRHGAVSVGDSIEQAYLRILALERACITFLHSS